jgi:hypothetical protein
VFAREVRSTDDAGIVRFELRDGDLEKSVRTAVLSFLNAANAAVTYYDSNLGPFQAYTDLIRKRIDEITVLG